MSRMVMSVSMSVVFDRNNDLSDEWIFRVMVIATSVERRLVLMMISILRSIVV